MEIPSRLRQAGVTAREAEVLEALASRLTNAEIAERLFISVRTVESHVSALLRKLEAPDRLALSGVAREIFGQRGVTPALSGGIADALSGAPFVGRSGELELLAALYEAVRAGGRRRLALVSGEAGIGKTRLAAEAAADCYARGALVLHGRCEQEALIPFQAFAEAIRPLVGGTADPMANLATAPGSDAAAHRYALFEEFDRRLASRPQPIVFVVDDAQWADPSGLQLLRHLLRHADRSSLLLIATARPEGVDPRHPLAAAVAAAESAQLVEFISLGGLSLPEVEALAAQMAGASKERARSAWERTAGNAFLVSELLRHGPGEAGLPTSARDAIVRRIAGLGPSVFEVLAGAAVIGETFRSDVVCAALGGDAARHSAALERAFGAGLLVEDRASPGEYRFPHAIVRDALISVTRPSQRAALHLRIAHVLETKRGGMALPEVARHRHAALPEGDPAAAHRAALAASAHAMDRFAYEVAATCAGMALDAVEAGGGDESHRAQALLARGNAHLKAGDLELAADDFRMALDVAHLLGTNRLRAQAVLGWAATFAIWGRNPQLRAALEELLACHVDDLDLRAQLKAKLAQVLYYEDARDRRIQLARSAVEDARKTGQPATLAAVLATTHAALWGPEDLDQRTAVAAEIVAVARRPGQPELEATGLGWLAADLLEDGDVRGADEALARHAVLAHRLQQRLLLRDTELWSAMRAILDGRFEDAVQSIERARDLGEAARDPSTESIYWVQRYWLACERGDSAEMDQLVEPCERHVRAHPEVPAWRAALAMLHARREDREAASKHFDLLAADGFRAIPPDAVWLNAMTYLAETCAFLRDVKRAPMLYRTLEPYANRIALIDRALACKGSVLRFLGLLAATTGDFQAAEQHLGRALERHEAMDARPLTERTLRDVATLSPRHTSSSAP